MLEFVSQSWPWYVAGPLIGLIVPALLFVGGKQFGISTNLRHLCAATIPAGIPFFRYDWKEQGLWNLMLVTGMVIGAFLAATLLPGNGQVPISDATRSDLSALGVVDMSGLVPREIFSFRGLATLRGFVMIVVGGFFVGFGSRYAGGCTSGHAIMGLADLQLPSLIATIAFFAGGLAATWFILPLLI